MHKVEILTQRIAAAFETRTGAGAIFVLIVLAALAMNNGQSMSPVWLGPYLSGAANLSVGGQFQIDVSEVQVTRSHVHHSAHKLGQQSSTREEEDDMRRHET